MCRDSLWGDPLIPAQAAAAALSKPKKPVWGRKRTLTYTTTVERDGRDVEATVVEESGIEVGSLGIGVAAVATAAAAGTVIGVATGVLEDPRQALAERKQRKKDAAAAADAAGWFFSPVLKGIGSLFGSSNAKK